MSLTKHMQIVERLAAKTKIGQANWELTIEDGVFRLNFPNSALDISIIETGIGDPDYILSVLNESGEVVERFSDVDLTRSSEYPQGYWFNMLRDMYSVARRTALGAERVLDDVLKALERS